jgi:uncharacterized protein
LLRVALGASLAPALVLSPFAMSAPSSSSAAAPVTFVADPTALGLIGLSIGCAALLPIAFGMPAALNPAALNTAAWFCLFFGAGCQFLAGFLSFLNKNMLGGTLMTAFSFNWVMNFWSLRELAEKRPPSAPIILSVDICFCIIFLVMMVAFGYFSKLLFAFLADIVALYIFRIARELTHSPAFAQPIAWATVLLMGLALYIAFALVLQNASGKSLLPMPGPLFVAKPAT